MSETKQVTAYWLALDQAIRIDGEVYCMGDIHGEFSNVDYWIDKLGLRDGHIIVLGDCGLGFYPKEDAAELEHLNLHAKHYGMHVWLIRGNHDDPSYWQGDKKEAFEAEYPSIRLLQQGPAWINDELHYIFPGAVSIDRVRRIEHEIRTGHKTHWDGCEVVFDEKIPTPRPKVKGVLAHTGHVPPTLRSRLVDCYKDVDDKLEADIKREKRLVEKVINTLRPEWWINGHYHHHWKATIATPKQLALDISEIVQLDYAALEGREQ